MNLSLVLLARVLSINSKNGESSTNAANDTNSTASGTWNYRIWHVRTWKGPIVATSALTTPNSECGVTGLLKDWDYFLTGKKGSDGGITFTSCDFVMPWTDITPGEHDLLMELMWDPKKCAVFFTSDQGCGRYQSSSVLFPTMNRQLYSVVLALAL
ncbi:hypothetical protein ANCDUO_09287 [Ancylostoma duodenale]|uniref:NTR domain-containing protein n=1 Tax=Ancylostoma duodenale TaxID=51022 RepID=A0A0C2GH10_9BILA|nr:hypothetical protein ANCDUO_09287 [Ancylostoma duodenale]